MVNAIDQCSIDKDMDTIKIDIQTEPDFCISVYNNGMGIPIRLNDDGDIYIPEMIFGQLLTSSNYDDNQERITGGRNGYGAKLANVFSKKFQIDIGDSVGKKRYIQEWNQNMTIKSKPKITSFSKSKGFVKITFYPDLVRFDLDNKSFIIKDIISLFKKRVYDACACTPDNTKIYLNGENINIKSFEKYTDLYFQN